MSYVNINRQTIILHVLGNVVILEKWVFKQHFLKCPLVFEWKKFTGGVMLIVASLMNDRIDYVQKHLIFGMDDF